MKTLPEKAVFYAALAPFIAFYVTFAAVLYPNAAALQPTYLIEGMMKVGVYGEEEGERPL